MTSILTSLTQKIQKKYHFFHSNSNILQNLVSQSVELASPLKHRNYAVKTDPFSFFLFIRALIFFNVNFLLKLKKRSRASSRSGRCWATSSSSESSASSRCSTILSSTDAASRLIFRGILNHFYANSEIDPNLQIRILKC